MLFESHSEALQTRTCDRHRLFLRATHLRLGRIQNCAHSLFPPAAEALRGGNARTAGDVTAGPAPQRCRAPPGCCLPGAGTGTRARSRTAHGQAGAGSSHPSSSLLLTRQQQQTSTGPAGMRAEGRPRCRQPRAPPNGRSAATGLSLRCVWAVV